MNKAKIGCGPALGKGEVVGSIPTGSTTKNPSISKA
jgi:hypothetical protein